MTSAILKVRAVIYGTEARLLSKRNHSRSPRRSKVYPKWSYMHDLVVAIKSLIFFAGGANLAGDPRNNLVQSCLTTMCACSSAWWIPVIIGKWKNLATVGEIIKRPLNPVTPQEILESKKKRKI